MRSTGSLPLSVLTFALLCSASMAQNLVPSTRIVNPIDESHLTTLRGAIHPLANARNDRGAAPDSMQLQRMHLILKRSASQEAALRQLIYEMHTPGSASYHKWLSPDEFGKQFGPSDEDIATIESWLNGQGFNVTKVNPGKQTIEFSGNVAQVRAAFHTQIHRYEVNGEIHYANASNPQIPAALAPVVGGFVSLNNFRPKNNVKPLGKAMYDPKTDKATPEWTIGSNIEGYSFVLAPGDFAVQYDLNPLYTAGIKGTGQSIAILNDSNINVDLVNQFRTLFGLPANPPQVIIDGNDPGVDGINDPDGPNYDSVEAYLDVEWSGAVAPNATIDLVVAADTALESGFYLAAEHAVYGNVAPIISASFGICEADLGSTNDFMNSLWEQAAAQGITVLISSGDNGSAGCDDDNTQDYAVGGQAVNGLASTPFNVAVGGTDFYYSDYATGGASITNYWSTTTSNNTPAVSLNKVIPEQAWNDSQFGLNINDYYTETDNTATNIVAGGGGASNSAVCNNNDYDAITGLCDSTLAGYPKPLWQTGTGVPNDQARDLPDLSLFAANGQNDSYYPICASDGDCQPVASDGDVQFYGVAGTSASTPAFAGIMALIDQRYGRQGQADFVLYPLATQFPSAFRDVAVGNNSVPCSYSPSSPNCISVSSPITVTDPVYGTATEGQIGTGSTPEYNATTGYDLATGLGTIDAANLVNDWGNVTLATSTTTLNASSTNFTHGTAITISGNVTTAGGTPSGDVALMTDSTEPVMQGQTFFTLSDGSYSSSVSFLPGGTYNIWGQYGGDSAVGMSTSAKTQITVNPEASTTWFNIYDEANPYETGTAKISSGATGIPYGTQLILDAEAVPTTYYNQCIVPVSPPTSCNTFIYTEPTGTITFADNGNTINTAVINTEGDAEYNGSWSVGSHSVTASYAGDDSYTASTGAPTSPITFSIAQDTPTLLISSANQTSTTMFGAGQPTVFSIQVENSANLNSENTYGFGFSNPVIAPTGTVTVTGFPTGVPTSATLSAAVDPTTYFAEGVGTITVPATVVAGTYTVLVSYGGDANYAATSQSFTVQIVGVTGLASTTAASFTGSISPVTSIIVSGTVTGQNTQAPTGTVNFFSSGYSLGSISITPASTGDVSSFVVQLDSQNLFQGANLITVQYSGDTVYAPSSTTLNLISSPLSDFSLTSQTTIVPITAGSDGTTTIYAASENGFSGPVNLTCTPASGITCPNPASIGLGGGGSGSSTLTISAASTTPDGNYNVLVTGTDSTGTFVHTLNIEAVVSGSSASAGSFALSNSGNIGVNGGATTGNTSTISVTPAGGFTGTVDLTCNVTTSLATPTSPPTCSLASPSVTISGTTAQTDVLTVITTSTTTGGEYYVGVVGVAGSLTESTTVDVNVTSSGSTGTFTVSAAAASPSSIAPGATATSTVTVSSSNGYAGVVTLSCALTQSPSGAVDPPTCSNGSSTVTLSSGTTSGTATVTVSTTAATTSALIRPRLGKGWTGAGGGAVLALLIFLGIPARRRNWRHMLGAVAVMIALGGMTGCGDFWEAPSGNTSGGTTAGTYTFTVTGTGNPQATAPTSTFTVSVN